MAQPRPPVTELLCTGRLRVRTSRAPDDLLKIQALRDCCFKPGQDVNDPYDGLCTHVLIEAVDQGDLLGAYRMLPLTGAGIAQSYAAQFYDLSGLARFPGPMVEMGRFCIHPTQAGDPDILRLAWAAMTRYVDEHAVDLLFGCASFAGVHSAVYADSFALLKERHIAPRQWRPAIKAPDVVRYAAQPARRPDVKQAMRSMPPLLRSYLAMGGWVSDHAVVDHQMDTLHVFTGVETSAIPEARKRLLRALAG